MEMIRTLPDVESKTARTFYHSIQNIRGYMQQLQRDAENLLHTLDHQSGVIDFRPLSRLLLRLKKTEWIDRICEGTYNSMIRHIRDELEERANQLESRLMRLDLSLKFPENIRLALEIIEKIESMNILENTIPILKNYRDRINEYFIKIINEVFNHIKKTFNFANKTIDHLKQELIEIEQIKNEYDTLYPARSYLRKFGYSDIDILNQKIENLRVQHDVELKEAEAEKSRMESQLDNFNITIRHYQHLTSSKIGFGIFDRLFNTIGIGVERVDIQPNEYLKQKGYLNIEIFNDTMTKVQKDYDKQLRLIEQRRTEFNNTLTHFESIIKEYDSLLASSNLISSKVIDFLQEKGQYSYELLEKTIQEKKKILTEYEKYDVIEDPPNQKFLTQIKNKLQPSLSKVIKNTKTCAHHLNGKIERVEDNRNEIREINENIEKIRIVLNEHHIMELIDKPTKEVLQNFENEINEILSKAILNAIENIKMFIEANSFLEAEQYMKNLKHAQNGLASYYTSKSVYNKIEELEIKLNCLVSDILQRYDFSDINNYSKNPPKDLITQLKK
ncbi:unnamed protein product, partial [Rotaria sordida]